MPSIHVERKITIQKSTADDAIRLAPLLRQADKDEIQAASGSTPLIALSIGKDLSNHCWTGFIDDTPVCMFGVVQTQPRVGAVWLLGSDQLWTIPVAFCRYTKYYLKLLHDDYDVLFNCVDERNTIHLKWLKWSGFTFLRRIPAHGHEQRPFVEFVRIATHV